jgi:hypothetical protein
MTQAPGIRRIARAPVRPFARRGVDGGQCATFQTRQKGCHHHFLTSRVAIRTSSFRQRNNSIFRDDKEKRS